MRAEIVSVGTELLLGQIVDTNAVFLSQDLAMRGIDVLFRSTVGDNPARLADTLERALSRSDIVVTIAGLGPTDDDITKEVCAQVTGIPLVRSPEDEERLRDFFSSRGVQFHESNLKQALKPASGVNLANPNGTAPGCIFDTGDKAIICLPGPPYELKPMWMKEAIPWLKERGMAPGEVLRHRMLRFIGIGESLLEPQLKDLMTSANPTVAPYAKTGEVHVRIAAKAADETSALQLIQDMENRVRQRAGQWIYGVDEETLESVVVRDAVTAGATIATAESCTGGLVASRLTDVPGSSAAFLEGLVCYSNQAKTDILGVPAGMIQQHGAVSEEVARAMAEGALERSGASVAVSDTGIAGPSGGSEEKPVGLVWIAAASSSGTSAQRHLFVGDRLTVKSRASNAALALLRETLAKDFPT